MRRADRETSFCLITWKGLEHAGPLPFPGREETAVPRLGNRSQVGSGPGKDSRMAPRHDLRTAEWGAHLSPQLLAAAKTLGTVMIMGPGDPQQGSFSGRKLHKSVEFSVCRNEDGLIWRVYCWGV